MSPSVTSIVVALIAFAGTLAGLVFAVKKWRSETASAARGDFSKARQNAYRQLWELVEQLHVDLRTDAARAEDLPAREQAINVFGLKSGIYIDDADRQLANDYVGVVQRFHAAVASSKDGRVREAFERTDAIPRTVATSVAHLAELQDQASRIREKLVTRVRAVLTEG